MVSSELGPQLQFLTDAAHLLSDSSPETSAFLMSRRTTLLVDHDLPIPEHQRQHVCSCCGHIMVPGRQGTEVKIVATDKALKARVRKQPKAQGTPAAAASSSSSSSQRPGMSKVFTCGKCSRYTKLQLPAPRPLKTRGKRSNKVVDQQKTQPEEKRPAAAAAAAAAPTEPARMSANASSKKRAKNRKAGLQALLDQRSGQNQNPSASSGLGLSFSDFLKK